ncbi:MAG: hypothetical protein M3P40_06795 [Actinomycetota bacterium]|nr:hypothetical protein [Actinomycetota bacterium]
MHPFAIIGAFGFVTAVALWLGSATGLVVGACAVVLGAFLTFRLQNALYLPATVSGGTICDVCGFTTIYRSEQ